MDDPSHLQKKIETSLLQSSMDPSQTSEIVGKYLGSYFTPIKNIVIFYFWPWVDNVPKISPSQNPQF
jgi:hypothetical protein